MKHIVIRDLITWSFFLLILSSMTGCGDNTYLRQEIVIGNDLDATYFFPLGGSVEVSQDQYGRVSVAMLDYITSINPENGTYGEHPKTNISDRFLTQDKTLYFSQNVNYNSGDLEQDVSGANITGTKRTDFTYKWIGDKLELNIKIFNSEKNDNINSIILDRTYTGRQ